MSTTCVTPCEHCGRYTAQVRPGYPSEDDLCQYWQVPGVEPRVWVEGESDWGTVVGHDWDNVIVRMDSDGVEVLAAYEQIRREEA